MLPIFLEATCHLVKRDSLLFCYCGLCQKQLSWRPLSMAHFHSQCCNVTYDAEPIDINVREFQVVVLKHDGKNVLKFERKKPEVMTFAGG